jgi:hypothetical protein
MDFDREDQIQELLDACGRAFGAALAFALVSRSDLSTKAGLLKFAGELGDLCDAERFSPDVTLVMSGVIGGMAAVASARPDSDGEIV